MEKSGCSRRMGRETQSKWRCGEQNDVGKAGERHMSHEDSKESSEIPQGIVWQFHVWQGKVTAGSEDTSNPPGTCWNRVHMADLTPIRNLSGRLRCSGIKRLQALTIP